jgi:long-chain acyl-CoA synthetase
MTEAPAIRSGESVRPIAEAQARAARLASALRAYGVHPGDRVAVVLRNGIEFLEASIAAGLAGAVPVPVNWHWTGDELAYLLADSGSVVAFAHTDLLPGVAAAAPDGMRIIEVPPPRELVEAYGVSSAPTGEHPLIDDVIAAYGPLDDTPAESRSGMIYTSGTTGRPKGILREPMGADQALELAQLVFTAFGLRPGMRTMVPAPMYHTAPNTHALMAVSLGCDLTTMPRFEPEDFLRVVEANRVEHIQTVPTMFVRLLRLPKEVRERYDLSSLKAIVHAAAPCPPDVKRAIIDWFGPIILEYYGGSETGIVVACDSPQWLAHPGTVGTAVAGAGVRVLAADDTDVPTGEIGEVYLKPPPAWPNFTYLGADAKREAMERDGHLTVGDMGYLDDDGFLYLTDRRNDMVISGGVNIYPAEIENCLIGMDGVRDVAVFGIPDPDFGEALAAHVEAEPGVTADAVRAYARDHLAGYKVPKVVVFERELPREDSGKLFKRRLREPYWSDTGRRI